MTSDLPPSKFGAGFTYGSSGDPVSPPAPPTPQYPTPQYPTSPVPDPYGATTAFQSPPADPYGAPPPDPYGAPAAMPGQPANPDPFAPPPDPYGSTSYQQPGYPAGVPGFVGAGGVNGTTTVIAAVLCLLGAVRYGIDLIANWGGANGFAAMFDAVEALSKIGAAGGLVGWLYGAIAAFIGECIAVPVLALAAILLFTRSPAGRALANLGSVIVVLVNGYLVLAAMNMVSAFGQISAGEGGKFAGRLFLEAGLPIALAIAVMVLVSGRSCKAWCQKPTSYPTPTTY